MEAKVEIKFGEKVQQKIDQWRRLAWRLVNETTEKDAIIKRLEAQVQKSHSSIKLLERQLLLYKDYTGIIIPVLKKKIYELNLKENAAFQNFENRFKQMSHRLSQFKSSIIEKTQTTSKLELIKSDQENQIKQLRTEHEESQLLLANRNKLVSKLQAELAKCQKASHTYEKASFYAVSRASSFFKNELKFTKLEEKLAALKAKVQDLKEIHSVSELKKATAHFESVGPSIHPSNDFKPDNSKFSYLHISDRIHRLQAELDDLDL